MKTVVGYDVFCGSGGRFVKSGKKKCHVISACTGRLNRKLMLQSVGVEFQRCADLPSREGLTKDACVTELY